MPEYKHKEAFCLMWYQCRKCGGRIRVWNSRDGVTPFGMQCRAGACSSIDMMHVDWAQDECVPDHVPGPRDRVFVDMTEEQLRAVLVERIERYWDDTEIPMCMMFEDKEAALRVLFKGEWNEGEPWVATGEEVAAT